jgi:SAM-dependent methyltransferase
VWDKQRGVDPRVIQADFDRIAALPGPTWDHNRHYHAFLLRHLPPRCGQALDLGCGTGEFARVLAGRAERVLGLDLSPRMIEVALARSRGHRALDFQVADAMTWDWPAHRFDCIASIATLHHLPMDTLVPKLRRALTERGVLLVLDLYRTAEAADLVSGAVAMPLSVATRLIRTGHLRQSATARAAWQEHSHHDTYLTLAQVRRLCAAHLPGAQVRRHLFWRYSIVWRNAEDYPPAS